MTASRHRRLALTGGQPLPPLPSAILSPQAWQRVLLAPAALAPGT